MDGPTVIPACTNDGTYAEWEFRVGRTWYVIINEFGDDGDWTLFEKVQTGWANDWHEIGSGTDIDALLKQHNLSLGA